MTAPDPAPRPTPSAEARRLIDVLKECSGATGVYHLCTSDAVAADTHEESADAVLSAYVAKLEVEVARLTAVPPGRWQRGARVRKTKGSSWHGRVVGFYSTALTPIGYAVESEREPGSVQIYPEAALEAWEGAALAQLGADP